MDLRRVALTALLLVAACGPARAAADDDSTFAVRAALEDEAEFVLDPETLAELDALLVDPVDLESGDLQRLRAIPWLEDEAMGALERATPPHDVEELSQVPGWDAGRARRLAPFVRFARPMPKSTSQIALAATDAALGGRIESRSASAACRAPADAPRDPHGFGRARWGRTTLVLGDLRAGHAQGLLAWTGETPSSAAGSVWRNARGLAGTDALASARTMRGAGIEWRGAGARAALAAGRGPRTAQALATLAVAARPGCEIQAALHARREAKVWSLGARIGSDRNRFAFEAAGRDRPSVAAAGELRGDRLRCGARLEVVRREQLPETAGASSSVRGRGARSARIAAGARLADIDLDAALAQELRDEPEGRTRLRGEALLGARGRRAGTGFEARCAWRVTRTDEWSAETALRAARVTSRSFLVRVDRRPRPGWRAVLELRGTSAGADSVSPRTGHGWSLRVDRERGALRPSFACGSFRTDPGISLAAPSPGMRLGSIRVRGDGVYAAIGLRASGGGCAASAGLAACWAAAAPVRVEARWSLAVELP